MPEQNAFELAPACARCGGKGSVAFEGKRPRPDFAQPCSDEQLVRLQLWARGLEPCPECGGRGEVRRTLTGVTSE